MSNPGPNHQPRFNSLRINGVRSIKNNKNVSRQNSSHHLTVDYQPIRLLGQGAFGQVFSARGPDGTIVAVKKVLQDPRYKNRELDILRLMKHRNVVTLKHAYKSRGQKQTEVYLNIVMDFLPLTLSQFIISYRQQRMYPPVLFIKLFLFQLFSGLHYLHSLGISHRDIKPPNVLVDVETGELRICDLGSAKMIKPGDKSVSYIASRFYRAPELVMGCVEYTDAIDIWAAGCVFAEALMAGTPLFPGQTSMSQLNEIIRIIGPPSDSDLQSFQHEDLDLPDMKAEYSLEQVLPDHTPKDVLDLLERIFVYNPKLRPTALECMKHPCFDDLFVPGITLPNKKALPPLDRNPTPDGSKLPNL